MLIVEFRKQNKMYKALPNSHVANTVFYVIIKVGTRRRRAPEGLCLQSSIFLWMPEIQTTIFRIFDKSLK
jgi:hypothetical protein